MTQSTKEDIMDGITEFSSTTSDSIFTRFVVDIKALDEEGNYVLYRAYEGCVFNETNIVIYNSQSSMLIQYRTLNDFALDINPDLGYLITFLDKDLQLYTKVDKKIIIT